MVVVTVVLLQVHAAAPAFAPLAGVVAALAEEEYVVERTFVESFVYVAARDGITDVHGEDDIAEAAKVYDTAFVAGEGGDLATSRARFTVILLRR